MSLANTAQARMEHARSAAHGRSAQTVHGGRDRAPAGPRRPASRHHAARAPRHAGGDVAGARGPRPADHRALEAVAGDVLTVPAEAHTLDAVGDSALLLTVALMLGSPGSVALAPGGGPDYPWQEDWEETCSNASSRSPARRAPGSCSGS
jgi:hypothetical protein